MSVAASLERELSQYLNIEAIPDSLFEQDLTVAQKEKETTKGVRDKTHPNSTSTSDVAPPHTSAPSSTSSTSSSASIKQSPTGSQASVSNHLNKNTSFVSSSSSSPAGSSREGQRQAFPLMASSTSAAGSASPNMARQGSGITLVLGSSRLGLMSPPSSPAGSRIVQPTTNDTSTASPSSSTIIAPGSASPSESSYEGEWLDGRYHGRGKKIWSDGDRYEGEWRNGKQHGIGTYVWANGNKYTGEWGDGEQEGHGVYCWVDGDKYEGEWKAGEQDGRGVFVWADGDRYDGQYVEGKKHGFGIFSWSDGKRYEGEWLEGQCHGQGIKEWPNGDRYVGQWREGLQHGEGSFYYADGRRKEGAWVEDLPHGVVRFTDTDGKRYLQTYDRGSLLKSEPDKSERPAAAAVTATTKTEEKEQPQQASDTAGERQEQPQQREKTIKRADVLTTEPDATVQESTTKTTPAQEVVETSATVAAPTIASAVVNDVTANKKSTEPEQVAQALTTVQPQPTSKTNEAVSKPSAAEQAPSTGEAASVITTVDLPKEKRGPATPAAFQVAVTAVDPVQVTAAKEAQARLGGFLELAREWHSSFGAAVAEAEKEKAARLDLERRIAQMEREHQAALTKQEEALASTQDQLNRKKAVIKKLRKHNGTLVQELEKRDAQLETQSKIIEQLQQEQQQRQHQPTQQQPQQQQPEQRAPIEANKELEDAVSKKLTERVAEIEQRVRQAEQAREQQAEEMARLVGILQETERQLRRLRNGGDEECTMKELKALEAVLDASRVAVARKLIEATVQAQIEEQNKCLVCDDREREMVFTPCGHRICCRECGEKQTACALCDCAITGSVMVREEEKTRKKSYRDKVRLSGGLK